MNGRLLFSTLFFVAMMGVTSARAQTQAVTFDEANIYTRFVAVPWSETLSNYDAGHHLLQTISTKVSVETLGVSELTLRLPTLVGAGLYFSGAIVLSGFVFRSAFMGTLSLLLLTLNPFLLDFMSAARGYGLALGTLLWSFILICRRLSLQEAGGTPLYAGGGLLGLSVTANLTFLYPAIAIIVATVVVAAVRAQVECGSGAWRSAWDTGWRVFLPFALVTLPVAGFLICYANTEHFYYGASSLSGTLNSLTWSSLFNHPRPLGSSFTHPLLVPASPWIATVLLPGILIGIVAVATFVWRRKPPTVNLPALIVVSVTAVAIPAIVVAWLSARAVAGVPFPLARTGLYLIPLGTIGALGAIELTPGLRPMVRWAKRTAIGIACLCTLQYLACFSTEHYGEWRADAGTKEILQLIEQREHNSPPKSVRINASFVLEPGLNFYRTLWRLDWMEPVERERLEATADYIVVAVGDRSKVGEFDLQILFQEPVSETMLAVPRRGGTAF